MGAPREHVTVGIVGGGIAGLSLARMLELSGISYCLWESYRSFAPNSGASIGLMPSGLRILDQLGLYSQIKPYDVPHQWWEHRDGQGRLQAKIYSHAQLKERTGYGGFFLERQQVLQILYDNIRDKSKLSASKRVVAVKNNEQAAILVAADGSEVSCDFVAGADGVRSVVRQEIERQATDSVKQDSDRFDARYACVYGISDPIPEIGPGRAFTVYRPDVSLLIFTGRDSVYWFLFHDLKRVINYDKPERFSEEHIDVIYRQVADTPITDGVKFSRVYARKRTAVTTALEEGITGLFSHGRLFVLGDSAHKMVPHAAMGANQAIESAAAFVNVLRPLVAQRQESPVTHIPILQVEDCLNQYTRRRRERVTSIQQLANRACRAQLKIGKDSEEFWLNLPKLTGEVSLSRLLGPFRNAEYLENWKLGRKQVVLANGATENIRGRIRANL
ncbi:uncharacterized protein N7459_004792 [Penicillium hispanicum]|uniref:uncharacterized protein n=1 Tax=Penicillium hispanicum TaxID=1080232 RepID=UPI00253FA506|nr:uncharacterized protein N7459_004792 [Penicillium hispanicum]KAJ5584992.1 hypothetical protein N7459_004792 [Penicillium hispanicum]